MIAASLLQRYPIISDQVDERELQVILNQLEAVLENDIPGDIVEFGCYIGTTSLFIRRLMDAYSSNRYFHVYDSFAGLPEKASADISPVGEQFKAGELTASKKEFIMNFKKAGLKLPIIHKGWFGDLSFQDVPTEICFAFLDGDYYDSINDSLGHIWPHLKPGAVVIVDDYANEALPGAQKAVDKWLEKHHARLEVMHSLAILYP